MSVAASCLLAGCHTLGTPGAFAVCQAADAATTLYALDRGAEELNPIVGAILDLSGPAGFIFAKIGVTVLVYRHYMENLFGRACGGERRHLRRRDP